MKDEVLAVTRSRSLAVLRGIGRAYAVVGQVYLGVGTVLAIWFLSGVVFWHESLGDAFGNAVFALFCWPVVLMGRAAN